MKKAAIILLSMVLLTALSISSFASDFAGSIEYKPSVDVDPTDVRVLLKDSYEILEYFTPEDGTRGLDADSPIEAEKDSPAEKALKEAAKELTKVDNVGELDEDIEKALKEKGIEPENTVITDIVYISLNQDEDDKDIISDHYISFRIEQLYSNGEDFILIQKDNDGKWVLVDKIDFEEDGFMRVITENLGVFAFVTEKTPDMPIDPDGPYSPKTDIGTGYKFVYAGVAVLFVAAAVFFFVKSKKRREA